jgi:5-methyltetrahydropteroyltriglutamate--homocysteine methyltransferase
MARMGEGQAAAAPRLAARRHRPYHQRPKLVAERLVRLAKLVGRERVIGSTDCGFAQGVFYQRVHPSIMWAKLAALAEGAKLATAELWGRGN